MDFFKQSIIRKVTALLFTAFIAIGLADFFAMPAIVKYAPNKTIGLLIRLSPMFAFFIFIILVLWVVFHRPTRKIFNEMKAFIAGKTYKKIFTERVDEMGVLAHFFNDITRSLEKVSITVAEGKRMSQEYSIGNEIQRKILPSAMPVIAGLSIYGNMRPATEIGGDSFDIIQAGNNALIYVGDVTGHGLPAALIMVMVNTIMRTYSEVYPSGYDILVNTNRILKQRIEPRRFMTCVLLRWNTQEQKLYYTGAGHEHVLIYRKRSGICEVRQTGGVALGMVPDISKIIKEDQIPIEKGDFIVLYSDGIIEAKNLQGEMFGVQRLKESVEKYAGVSVPDELFSRVSKDFAFFVGEQVQEDDITLIAVRRE